MAEAIWAKDPAIIDRRRRLRLTSEVITDPDHIRRGATGRTRSPRHRQILELGQIAQRGREVWFDIHISTDHPPQPNGLLTPSGVSSTNSASSPGAKFKVCDLRVQLGQPPTEACPEATPWRPTRSSGSATSCRRLRGELPPARRAERQRLGSGDALPQTRSQVWLQAPGYLLQMTRRHFQPILVRSEVAGFEGATTPLSINAKRSDDGRTLVLQVVNPTDAPCPTRLDVAGFTPSNPSPPSEQMSGPLEARNPAEAPDRIVPGRSDWRHGWAQGPPACVVPAPVDHADPVRVGRRWGAGGGWVIVPNEPTRAATARPGSASPGCPGVCRIVRASGWPPCPHAGTKRTRRRRELARENEANRGASGFRRTVACRGRRRGDPEPPGGRRGERIVATKRTHRGIDRVCGHACRHESDDHPSPLHAKVLTKPRPDLVRCVARRDSIVLGPGCNTPFLAFILALNPAGFIFARKTKPIGVVSGGWRRDRSQDSSIFKQGLSRVRAKCVRIQYGASIGSKVIALKLWSSVLRSSPARESRAANSSPPAAQTRRVAIGVDVGPLPSGAGDRGAGSGQEVLDQALNRPVPDFRLGRSTRTRVQPPGAALANWFPRWGIRSAAAQRQPSRTSR